MTNREQVIFEADRLTQQAMAAAQVGDHDEAQNLLRQATELDPNNAEAWLWLARVVDDLHEKREYFQRVLTLDPYNEPAKLGLERVEDKLGIAQPEAEEEVTYCTWHPNRETMLRCNRCGRPMCPECAGRHPVGLRCKECIRETRSPIYNVSAVNALLAFLAGTVASVFAGFIVPLFGFWVIFIAPVAGEAITRVIEFATPRKRGRALVIVASIGIVVGSLLAGLIGSLFGFGPGLGGILLNPFAWLYIAIAIGTVGARLR